MRHYELMVILDPDLEERTIAPSLDTFLNVVRNGGGTVEKVDVWGRRRLSFEIDKKAEGIYAVVDLQRRAGRHEGAGPPAQPQRVDPAHEGHATRAAREQAREGEGPQGQRRCVACRVAAAPAAAPAPSAPAAPAPTES